jgi:dynein heavy chain
LWFEEYRVTEFEQRDEYLEHIMGLPLLTQPQVFGFHPNDDITKDMNETNQVLDLLLLCSSEGSGQAGQSFSPRSNNSSTHHYEKTVALYPFNPKGSMNTVLTQ